MRKQQHKSFKLHEKKGAHAGVRTHDHVFFDLKGFAFFCHKMCFDCLPIAVVCEKQPYIGIE